MQAKLRIRELREAAGLTQKELAKRLYITQSSEALWELGKTYPSADKLPQIAHELGVTISELFVSVGVTGA